MRARYAIWVIGLGLLGSSGCMLAEQGIHVVAYKVQQHFQEHAELSRNRRWADEAWEAACRSCPALAADEDHAAGFRCGFMEQAWRGGPCEPPPLPPTKYRAVRYQSPAGYRAIEAWFAGYRHGAEVAQQGGYHDLVTGPSALRSSPAAAPPVAPPGAPPLAGPVEVPVEPPAAAPVPPRESAAPARAPEPLPQPRPVESPMADSAIVPPDAAKRWDWLDPRSTPTWQAPAPDAPQPVAAPREKVRLHAVPASASPTEDSVKAAPPAPPAPPNPVRLVTGTEQR
jgi:hypothetical protein